jgi:hypothetical protein
MGVNPSNDSDIQIFHLDRNLLMCYMVCRRCHTQALTMQCLLQELFAWSTRHQLPTSWSARHEETVRRSASQEESVWGSLGLSGLADTRQASSAADWQAVASAPNMLQAASLDELASVLGPEGAWQWGLEAAVLCFLRLHNQHMQQTIASGSLRPYCLTSLQPPAGGCRQLN